MADERIEGERLRAELVAADDALCDALDARARAHKALAALRARAPEAYVVMPRDHEVIARLTERAREFPRDAVRPVLTEVLSACARMTSAVTVAYVGHEGGFAYLAAKGQFGSSAALCACESAEDALAQVERGNASYAVLPFETSNDGAITSTLNLLARSDVKISAEIPVRRAFHIVSQSGDRARVKRIFAASSALAACEQFLAREFPSATILDVRNASLAAQQVKDDAESAALLPGALAEQSGLAYVERSIEDVADLWTRYVAVGHDFPPRTGQDRTAIALALHDAPGVLIECLRPFSDRKLNIFRLETRPARGWDFRYLILIEVDGHITDRPMLAATEELRAASRYVRVLGSYPITKS